MLPAIVVISLAALVIAGLVVMRARNVNLEKGLDELARSHNLTREELALIVADLATKGMIKGTGIDAKLRSALGRKPVIDVEQISTIKVVRDPKTGAVSYDVTLNTGAGQQHCSVEG